MKPQRTVPVGVAKPLLSHAAAECQRATDHSQAAEATGTSRVNPLAPQTLRPSPNARAYSTTGSILCDNTAFELGKYHLRRLRQ
jgi:hypothetical protein